MCPRCEGRGAVNDIDLTQLYDDSKSLNDGALTIPGYSMDGWYGRIFSGCGFLDPDKPIGRYTKRELHDLLLQGADQDQGRGHQPHLRGPDPEDPEVDAVQGRRLAAAAHPRLRRAGGHLHHLPGLRRHPAQRRRPARRRSAGLNIADACAMQISDLAEWVRGLRDPSVAPLLTALARHPRLLRRDRAGLPLPRPAVRHAVRRRGPADQDDPAPRLVAHRRHLRLRRADHRAAPARHPADERAAAAVAGQGQHRAGGRAQAGDHRDRRPRGRPRPGRRQRPVARWCSRARSRGCGPAAPSPAGISDDRAGAEAVGADADRRARGPRRQHRTTCATSTSTSRSACWWW